MSTALILFSVGIIVPNQQGAGLRESDLVGRKKARPPAAYSKGTNTIGFSYYPRDSEWKPPFNRGNGDMQDKVSNCIRQFQIDKKRKIETTVSVRILSFDVVAENTGGSSIGIRIKYEQELIGDTELLSTAEFGRMEQSVHSLVTDWMAEEEGKWAKANEAPRIDASLVSFTPGNNKRTDVFVLRYQVSGAVTSVKELDACRPQEDMLGIERASMFGKEYCAINLKIQQPLRLEIGEKTIDVYLRECLGPPDKSQAWCQLIWEYCDSNGRKRTLRSNKIRLAYARGSSAEPDVVKDGKP